MKTDKKTLYLMAGAVVAGPVLGTLLFVYLLSPLFQAKPSILRVSSPVSLAEARAKLAMPLPDGASNILYAGYAESTSYEFMLKFEALVEALHAVLPDFGKTLAIDGKAIETHGRPRRKDTPTPKPDGRRDTDANFGAKRRKAIKKDGTLYDKVKYWFGYKLHLVVDATYELPVARTVTPAANSEQPQAHRLLAHLDERHPELLKTCETWTADKGYDDKKLLAKLWDTHAIRPVIPVRQLWDKDEPTRRVSGLRHIVYNEKGEVYCYPCHSEPRRMAFAGFEADRQTLKYRCPASFQPNRSPALKLKNSYIANASSFRLT